MNDFALHTSSLGIKYYTLTHRSGVRIYLIPKDLSSSYAIFGTRFGGADSEGFPEGIAHFLEHKLFANENGEDTDERFARVGAYSNAYTSSNGTAYLFSSSENIYDALEVLIKSTLEPYFTAENVAKEQGIIAQEIKMYEDEPGDALILALLKGMYYKNPIRSSVVGTVESISHITAESLFECYRQNYDPANMVLILSGRFECDKVKEIVDRMLPSEEKEPLPLYIKYPDEPENVKDSRIVLRKVVSKPQFAIGIKDKLRVESETERARTDAALEILCSAAFGASSAINTSLYEEGLISNLFGTFFDHTRQGSHIIIEGFSERYDEVYERLCAYFEEIKKNGIPSEDIERSRKVIYSRLVRSFDTVDEVGDNLFSSICAGSEFFDYPKILSSITKEEIDKLACEIFQKEHYTLAVVLPLDTEE